MELKKTDHLVGAIEAGGTKFNCAIAKGNSLLSEERIPTRSPDETLESVIAFFEAQQKETGEIKALGIGSFGPVDLDPESKTFGSITTTPKTGWKNTDIVGPLKKRFNIPIGFDTDVNAAALGEWIWGAARGLDTFIYLTIGTGIGGGGIVNGARMHGLTHPEMGHIPIPKLHHGHQSEGVCPYHRDCFEGLASGPALEARWGKPAEELPEDHEAWVLESEFIAKALVSYIMTLSPQRIILGGGVMQQKHLFPMIRKQVLLFLNGYINHETIIDHPDTFIVPPKLEQRAGIIGAAALAYLTLMEDKT